MTKVKEPPAIIVDPSELARLRDIEACARDYVHEHRMGNVRSQREAIDKLEAAIRS